MRACRRCGTALKTPQRGRRPLYCGRECRRQVEFGRRRLVRARTQLDWYREHPGAYRGSVPFWEGQVAEIEALLETGGRNEHDR